MRSSFALSIGPIAALDNGPALPDEQESVALLVPGYTGSKEDFMPLLRPLASAGIRAIAIDQRGQYESAWAGDSAGYEIDRLAADVCELAATLGAPHKRLHLLGHSFGGLVGRLAVISRPDLFDTYTLMGSGPAAIGGQRRRWLDEADATYTARGMQAVWDQIAERSQADPRYLAAPPALREFLRRRFMANDPDGLMVMGRQLRAEPDRSAELAATGVPILVMHGVDDDAWPPAVQHEMAKRLGAQYQVVIDAAHSPAVENTPGTLKVLLDMWA